MEWNDIRIIKPALKDRLYYFLSETPNNKPWTKLPATEDKKLYFEEGLWNDKRNNTFHVLPPCCQSRIGEKPGWIEKDIIGLYWMQRESPYVGLYEKGKKYPSFYERNK